MSQVAKSASAFVRAFLAILVLELEDMVVRLVRPPKLAGVHGDRWTVRLGISVDVKSFAEVVYLERAEKLAHKTVIKGWWPWSEAKMPRQLGTMLEPCS